LFVNCEWEGVGGSVSGQQTGHATGNGSPLAPRRLDPVDLAVESREAPRKARRLLRLVVSAVRLVLEASPRGLAVAAALQLGGALAASGLVLVGQLVLDAMVHAADGSGGVESALPAVVLLGLLTAVSTGSTTLQTQQQRLLGEQVGSAVWGRLVAVTARVQLEAFETSAFHDRLQRVQVNALSRPLVVTTSLLGLLGGAAGAIAVGFALLSVEPLLVPVLLLAGGPALLLARRASRTEFSFAVAQTPTMRRRAYLRELLTSRDAAKEVRAFGTESALRRRHDVADTRFLAALRTQVRLRQRYASVTVLTSAFLLAATTGLLLALMHAGRISLAEAGSAVIGVRLLGGRLDQTLASMGSLFESGLFLDDLDRFLELAPVQPPSSPVASAPHRERMQLERVGYTYPGAEWPAVRDITLEIKPGEVVALVGENGSGKTTIAKLVAGLYTPQRGRITWDGHELADLNGGAVRGAVSVIFQDFVRYQLSARENIGLGAPDSVDDEAAARAAAVRAGADTFLTALPDGYDTVLSSEFRGGTELSVGQWQRVALARAFRREVSLVVLDEPSAALDPRAEQALFADIRRLVAGRSVLLISHRYSSVRTADRIYVVQDGRIVESGSHEELMALGDLYAELFTLQARAYL
jgi:ATP-binding cassette subfamily B protein